MFLVIIQAQLILALILLMRNLACIFTNYDYNTSSHRLAWTSNNTKVKYDYFLISTFIILGALH